MIKTIFEFMLSSPDSVMEGKTVPFVALLGIALFSWFLRQPEGSVWQTRVTEMMSDIVTNFNEKLDAFADRMDYEEEVLNKLDALKKAENEAQRKKRKQS